MATKLAAVSEYQPEARPNTGTVSAYVHTDFVGFHGNRVYRRVRIGVDYGVDIERAKAMITDIRQSNPNHNLAGRFVMEL